ncbi:LptA/OstA family protein [Erythrobacter sp. HL-111]|uniref:LptA/OstA family protein n=1 Tax=Erythrobacter sp. HL-111 TaxID=1798193 RepID=UPI0006DA3E39|nr:LptA/OstA family protein [Erythrobacter sp. HL-111]KPP86883.1 MAG: lipopolysaccharide export system chaperone component LptA [Erythrobacteraceae bacterium HL-111]SDS83046.1 lipopolysaccharide export system protein LptA [Erythrobacter sp. HL-111]
MTRKPTALTRTAIAWGAAGFLGTVALMGGIATHAQSIASHDSRAPVNYAADRIELQDRANRVVLAGGVEIDQAGLTMRAARTIVSYDDSGELRIDRITATGGVVVTRGNERASGNTAIYDFNRRVITLAGDVSLRRGTDTLNGGRLVIDLRSGLSSVDGRASGGVPGGSPGGRVSGRFQVPQED